LVLVQYRLDKVFAPVGVMEETLLWEGASALASILLVSGTLWFFVRRVGDERAVRNRRLAEAGEGSPEEDPSPTPGGLNDDTSKQVPLSDMTETQSTPESRK